MGIAEFIVGPAEGRTRWLYPSYALHHHYAGLCFGTQRTG
jgi:hypothetical protein